MRRFFIPNEHIENNRAKITGADFEHITKVLRMRVGDALSLADGTGLEYIASIADIGARELTLNVGEAQKCLAEPPYAVTVFQGLPKGDKLDVVVQKATELGAVSIVPTLMQRSVAEARSFEKKLERLNRIALEAAKQSGRGVVPTVGMPVKLEDVEPSRFELALLPYEEETGVSLKALLSATAMPKSIAVIIGPEGGFERAEVERLTAKGAKSVSLGPRILRTETAAASVLSMLMYEFEA